VQTAKERESKKMTEEIMQILSAPTTKEKSLMERFKSQGGEVIYILLDVITQSGHILYK
jgi:hypothetical protein